MTYRLKVAEKGKKPYIKKFANLQEVLSEMHFILFGYRAYRVSLGEIQANAKWQDVRFYLSIC